MPKHFTRRPDGRFQYRRRVPLEFRQYDPRGFIVFSLKTSDEVMATLRAREHDVIHETLWECLRSGKDPAKDVWARYEHAVLRTKAAGFEYRTMDDLLAGPLDTRVFHARALKGHTDPLSADAMLGAVAAPGLTLRAGLEKYKALNRDAMNTKGPKQQRKWELPRNRSIEHLIHVIGEDLEMERVTRDHALEFREWWVDRMVEEGLTGEGAKKDIYHLRVIYKVVSQTLRLKIENPFTDLRIKVNEQDRIPFPIETLRDKFLDREVMSGLNPEALAVLWVMIETGARPSEIVNLQPDCIRLDTTIPYIDIKPRAKRALKSKNAERKIPLVGASLLAFRELAPNGLSDRYGDKEDVISATCNKFLKSRGLRPDPKMTLYSIRHNFKDRMGELETPLWIQEQLMGHRASGEEYGKGSGLEQKHKWLTRMALPIDRLAA